MTNKEFIQSIALPGEEWRDVVGYEGRYCVSSRGRVVALSAPYFCGNRFCRRKPHLMKGRVGTCSYPAVVLTDGQRGRKAFLIHRLVATAFIPNPEGLPYINHKDETPDNNSVENLEWCTQSYNCNYGGHNERMARTISETAYQKRAIVQLSMDGGYIRTYSSIREAAESLQIQRASISICCRKPNRSGRGYRWMYLSDYESLISMSKNSNLNSGDSYGANGETSCRIPE